MKAMAVRQSDCRAVLDRGNGHMQSVSERTHASSSNQGDEKNPNGGLPAMPPFLGV